MIGDFDVDLAHEFFQGFVNHALVTLHIDNLRGDNAHHQCETVFKAFARALRMAVDARSARRRRRCRRPRGRSRPHRAAMRMTNVAVVDYGMGNLRSVSKAVAHVAPDAASRWSSRPTRGGARRRARRAARARARCPTACASCATRGLRGGGARGRARPSRSSASASACRCCSSAARRQRHAGPRPDRRRRACAFASTAGRQPDGSRSRCRTWAGTRCARRGRTRCGQACPTAAASISCTATTPRPSDARHSAANTDYGDALYLARVARDNIFATQFHPEKSAAAGLALLSQLPRTGTLDADPTAPRAAASSLHPLTAVRSAMLLIPAIDLKDGHCVRLKQGDMNDVHRLLRRPGGDGAALARRRARGACTWST